MDRILKQFDMSMWAIVAVAALLLVVAACAVFKNSVFTSLLTN